MFNLLRAIPFQSALHAEEDDFFHNLDVWDIVMHLRLPERLAALADPERRARMREQALEAAAAPARRARSARAVALDLRSQGEARQEPGARRSEPHGSGERQNRHVADVMLDLALEEELDTEFQLMTRSAKKSRRSPRW